MSTKQIATSTLWQIASQCVMAALSILTVKFVAMGLSKELFGNYNSAYGYLQLFGILADFGLYAIAVREVSRAHDRAKVLGVLIVLRSIILILSLGSALLIVWAVPMWRGTPLPLGVSIAVFVPFFTLLAGILRTIFQVNYKMQYVFIAEVGQRILTAGLIGWIVLLGVRETTDIAIYQQFLWIGGAGAALLFLISLIAGSRFMKIRPEWDIVLLKKIARTAAPYGLAFLFMALYRQFDVTMIAFLRPDFEVQNAYYGPVIRMMDMAFLLPTFLLNSVLPILSERDAKGENTRTVLGKTFLLILLLGIIAAAFSFLWSRPLIELLTTTDYLSTSERPGSDTALQLLALPMFLNGIILFSFYALLTRHAWQPLVLVLAGAAVLSIVLNALLIPLYGFVGASITSIAVNAVLAPTLLFFSGKTLPFDVPFSALARVLLFAGLLAVMLLALQPFASDSLKTILLLCVATGMMGILGIVTGLPQALGLRK